MDFNKYTLLIIFILVFAKMFDILIRYLRKKDYPAVKYQSILILIQILIATGTWLVAP